MPAAIAGTAHSGPTPDATVLPQTELTDLIRPGCRASNTYATADATNIAAITTLVPMRPWSLTLTGLRSSVLMDPPGETRPSHPGTSLQQGCEARNPAKIGVDLGRRSLPFPVHERAHAGALPLGHRVAAHALRDGVLVQDQPVQHEGEVGVGAAPLAEQRALARRH